MKGFDFLPTPFTMAFVIFSFASTPAFRWRFSGNSHIFCLIKRHYKLHQATAPSPGLKQRMDKSSSQQEQGGEESCVESRKLRCYTQAKDVDIRDYYFSAKIVLKFLGLYFFQIISKLEI